MKTSNLIVFQPLSWKYCYWCQHLKMKPLLLSLVSLFSPPGGGVNRLVVPHGFLFLFLNFFKEYFKFKFNPVHILFAPVKLKIFFKKVKNKKKFSRMLKSEISDQRRFKQVKQNNTEIGCIFHFSIQIRSGGPLAKCMGLRCQNPAPQRWQAAHLQNV